MTKTPTIPALALALTLAATPLLAGGLAFEPVVPDGLPADRAANVAAFQASIGPDQLAAMEAEGYGAYGAIAIPIAMPGAPVTLANLPSQAAAEAAVLEACKSQAGTACTVIGYLLPAGG